MDISVLVINQNENVRANAFNVDKISTLLSDRGYFVNQLVCVSSRDKVWQYFDLLSKNSQALLVLGEVNLFRAVVGEKYQIPDKSIFTLGELAVALSDENYEKFVYDTFIPLLNGMSRTFYTTSVFKVFNKTESELKLLLKDYLKNRNRISVQFEQSVGECTVKIRYSSKTSKESVIETLDGVTALLGDDIYCDKDIDIENVAAELLLKLGKPLGIAESFTGGSVTASLVKIPGISAVLSQGHVCYSNEAKIKYLGVDEKIINNYGAVSSETAYEMAAGLLMHCNCDVSVATTGNAGPTSERPDEVGVCYIAAGDKSVINLYRYKFDGDRDTVIECGRKAALYHLIMLLRKNDAITFSSLYDTDFPENA